MNWFLCALLCLTGWGFADLFYKMSSDESDRYSHLKIAVWVGLVMSICSFLLLPYTESHLSGGRLLANAVKYLPASLSYILSMVIGYAGLRYLELSIVSPVQNASGALSVICMIIFFVMTGRSAEISETFSLPAILGTALAVAGVIGIAIVEHQESVRNDSHAETGIDTAPAKNYRTGALALLFPILYCVFDTIGTAADGIILTTDSGLGEIDVIVLYGFTFLLAGIVCWIILWVKTKKPYLPFARSEWPKAAAAVCEMAGQIFYVYAMAENPMLAAPMVATYCILSVILSRIFLKEKLKPAQMACVFTVILGVALLGLEP